MQERASTHSPVCKQILFLIQSHSQGTHSPDLGGHEQPHTSCLSHSHYLVTHAQVPLKLLPSKPQAPSPTLPFIAVSRDVLFLSW